MTDPGDAKPSPRDRVQVALTVAAAVAWLVAAGPPGEQSVAAWVGMLAFHLLAALLIRWVYTRRQVPRPALLSPALFLIAAGIALLGRVGPERVETALQGTSTMV